MREKVKENFVSVLCYICYDWLHYDMLVSDSHFIYNILIWRQNRHVRYHLENTFAPILYQSRGSTVGIATGYGLDNRGVGV
jgi:hypothetical protein